MSIDDISYPMPFKVIVYYSVITFAIALHYNKSRDAVAINGILDFISYAYDEDGSLAALNYICQTIPILLFFLKKG